MGRSRYGIAYAILVLLVLALLAVNVCAGSVSIPFSEVLKIWKGRGAAFCLFCDLLARVMFAPTELSISTVTAVFGAPVVIGIMLRRRKERG